MFGRTNSTRGVRNSYRQKGFEMKTTRRGKLWTVGTHGLSWKVSDGTGSKATATAITRDFSTLIHQLSCLLIRCNKFFFPPLDGLSDQAKGLSSEMPLRFHYTVHGAVQGVWFRRFTKQTADELGIVGWVKNDAVNTIVHNQSARTSSHSESDLGRKRQWCCHWRF